MSGEQSGSIQEEPGKLPRFIFTEGAQMPSEEENREGVVNAARSILTYTEAFRRKVVAGVTARGGELDPQGWHAYFFRASELSPRATLNPTIERGEAEVDGQTVPVFMPDDNEPMHVVELSWNPVSPANKEESMTVTDSEYGRTFYIIPPKDDTGSSSLEMLLGTEYTGIEEGSSPRMRTDVMGEKVEIVPVNLPPEDLTDALFSTAIDMGGAAEKLHDLTQWNIRVFGSSKGTTQPPLVFVNPNT